MACLNASLLILHFRNWYYGEKKIKSANNEAENHSYFAGIEVFAIFLDFAGDNVF